MIKPVTIAGVTYASIADALSAYGTSRDLYENRRAHGWDVERSIITPALYRAEAVIYDGVEYPSVRAVCAKFSVSNTTVRTYAREHNISASAAVIALLDKRVWGPEYPNFKAFCMAYNLSYQVLCKIVPLDNVPPDTVRLLKLIATKELECVRYDGSTCKMRDITFSISDIKVGTAILNAGSIEDAFYVVGTNAVRDVVDLAKLCGVSYLKLKPLIGAGLTNNQVVEKVMKLPKVADSPVAYKPAAASDVLTSKYICTDSANRHWYYVTCKVCGKVQLTTLHELREFSHSSCASAIAVPDGWALPSAFACKSGR